MGNNLRRSFLSIFSFFLLAILLVSCSGGEYWIPPSSAGVLIASEAGQPDGDPIFPADTQSPPDVSAPTPANLETLPASFLKNTPQLTPNAPGDDSPILYYSQAADTLPAVAVRFGVKPEEISSSEPIPENSFLKPGQLLIIPRVPLETTSHQHLLPDSEIVYSPSATDFDIAAYIDTAGGKLSTFSDWLKSTGQTSGAAIVQRVAIENSINPRLLLALLEYESGWVFGQPQNAAAEKYPMGLIDTEESGLYNQLVWAVNQLSTGYYAWREGRLTDIKFSDGSSARLAPDLNAGTAALQYYFAQKYQANDWVNALDPATGFPAQYAAMFGDPWERAKAVEPLFPRDIRQPGLNLPFQRDHIWSYTGGPHGAWELEGSYAALDFAPASSEPGCVKSSAWVVASASGQVVRSGNGVVVVDLDGDGHEQTGWVLVYLHVSSKDRIPEGTWVGEDDFLGHPSCEGGISTGTHVHIARKYNGEWMPAAGPIPFNLGGWTAQYGGKAYEGNLTRDGQLITACTCSSAATFITRGQDDP